MRSHAPRFAASHEPTPAPRARPKPDDGIAREAALASREGAGLPVHDAPPHVGAVLAEPGQALEPSARAFFEPRFGHDFGRIRIHADDRAAASAEAMGAVAYAAGPHLVFNTAAYRPHTGAGRELLAHELTHAMHQQHATTPTIQPKMKFELQTSNVLWRGKGKPARTLPRKFGPLTNERFLHQGPTGTPSTAATEGDTMELQSEAGSFVEFETAAWLDDWCDVKARIQDAVDMATDINNAPIFKTFGSVDIVSFPFDTKHLAATTKFGTGLVSGETLFVELQDRKWNAKIQASESFQLEQFESYLQEHIDPASFTSITGHADTLLKAANTRSLPDADVAALKSLLQIIVEYVAQIQTFNTSSHPLAKENISLMSRTNFASIYRHLLSADEQALFTDIAKTDAIPKEFGLTGADRVFPHGFTGRLSPGPTFHEWLVSIPTKGDVPLTADQASGKVDEPHDRLSSLGGDNRAMGRFDVGKSDLVKFEARATSGHTQVREAFGAAGWVAFAKEVFKAAATNRARSGKTALIFDPTKCP